MAHLTKSLAVLASLGLAGAALAQTATTPAPAETAPAAPAPAAPAPAAPAAPEAAAPAATAPATPEAAPPAPEATPAPEAAPAPEATTPAPEAPPAPVPGAVAPAPGAAAPAAPADGVGSTYVKESFGDWSLRCVKTGSERDPCELYQLLKDGDGNSVAEISVIALPKGGNAVAGATLITPLETSLLEQIAIGIDSAKPVLYPFAFCTTTGCVSRIGFTAGELAALKKGNKGTVSVAPISAPKGQKVALNLSLSGFTAGFDAVAKANEGLSLQ